MNVEVKLFATLRKYLPEHAPAGCATLELPEGATVGTVIERLGIPSPLAKLVMVDGQHELDRDRRLTSGQVVSIFPPVAGGAG